MSSNFHINVIKKQPHMVFKADIKSEDNIRAVCNFLLRQKNKTLEIIINGRGFKFTSQSSRKSFVDGLRASLDAMSSRISDMESRLNTTLSDRDKVKNELSVTKQKLVEATSEFRTKYAVMDIKTAAWLDRLVEWEDNCKYLSEQVSYLRKQLDERNGNNKEPT